MEAKKYILNHFDDFFVILFGKNDKSDKLVILKEKFTIDAKEGDLLEISINEEKTGYEFKIIHEEADDKRQRLLDLIENMEKN